MEATSYTNTNQGQPVTTGGVTLIGGALGFGTSDLDWDGTRSQAPTNDFLNPNGYFDITNRTTFRGFHTFAQPLEATSYTNTNQGQPVTNGGVTLIGGALGFGTSDLDWDGVRSQAPTNDFLNPNGYFDQTNRITFRGFHTFAQPREATSYTNTSQAVPVIGGGVTLIGGALGFGTTDLDWDGLRSQAPTNDINNPNGYFDQNNIATRRGFHTFATPLEQTSYQTVANSNVFSLAPNATNFDWDGTDPYSFQTTNFFGFTPTNRFGFMVNMSQLDGTAYPIINPIFNSSILNLTGVAQTAQRFALSSFRQLLQPLQTNNLEQFAPLSFGGKTISGFKATLDNQSPVVNVQKYGFNITGFRRRGKSAGQIIDLSNSATFLINQNIVLPFMDVNRYTLGGGVDSRPTYVDGEMALWANTGNPNSATQPFSTMGANGMTAAQVVALNRSFNGLPYYNGVLYKSHIDYQYSKYNLVRDSYNTSTTYPQPFIDTSINGDDRDFFSGLRGASNNIPNSATIPGAGTLDLTGLKSTINQAVNLLDRAQSFDEGIVRGGIVKNTVRALLDAKRITRFLLSPKGLLWNVKQIGLQFMNPRVDAGTGFLDSVLGLNWTNIYNPLSVPLNVAGRAGILGLRLPRHGAFGFSDGAYEDIAVGRERNTNKPFDNFSSPSFFDRTGDYNRLVSLTKELLPQSYRPILITNLPTVDGKSEIDRLSTSFGGPNSILGLFGTTINRSRHPYKIMNTTEYFPTKENIEKGLDREVFWGGVEQQQMVGPLSFLDAGRTPKYADFIVKNYANTDVEQFETPEGVEFGGIILALKKYIETPKPTNADPRAARTTKKVLREPYGVQKITAKRLWGSGFAQFRHPSLLERVRNISEQELSSLRAGYAGLNTHDVKQNDHSAIKNYTTQNYEQLGRSAENYDSITDTIKLQDFRSAIEGNNNVSSFISSPKIIDFKNNNLEDRFGIGSQGEPGNDRKNLYLSNVQYSSLLPASSVGTVKENPDGTRVVEGNQILSNYQYASYPTLKDEVVSYRSNLFKDGFSEDSVKKTKFRGDRINIIDWKRSTTDLSTPFVYEKYKNFSSLENKGNQFGGAEDLIQFYFSGPNLKASEYNPTEAIVFRAYIDTIVDNHKPSWTPIKYIGRADPVYSYDGYERDINFGFTVHIGSRDELKASWRKLNMLASWTAPQYTDYGFMKAPVVRLNLGNLYRKFPGFLSTLTYTFDNTQTTWETAKLEWDQKITGPTGSLSRPGALELPKTINVQCTFVTFNIYRPEWDCVFYSLFDDSTGDGAVETGLTPIHDNRVNYFRTFDDLPASHPMNSDLCAISGVPERPKKPVEKKQEIKPDPIPQPAPTKCLCPIVFCIDEDRYVTDPSKTVIQELLSWLKDECDCARITLIGHANNMNKYDSEKEKDLATRDRTYNIELSKSRAITVKNLILQYASEISYPIDPSRIQTTGVGYANPLPGTDPSDVRNIRIEVRIDNPDETASCIKIDLSCKDNPKCSPITKCERVDIGDKSQFWLVGPQYFTTKYYDPYAGSSAEPDAATKAISEKVDGYWWVPTDGVSWRTKWTGRGYKVKGYGLKKNQSGWSDTQSRYDTKGGTISTFRPNPKHKGSLEKEETE